jgi:hypothetical protein
MGERIRTKRGRERRLQTSGVEHGRKQKELRRREPTNESRFDAAVSDAVGDRGARITGGPHQETHPEITADFLEQTGGEAAVEREGNAVRLKPGGGRRVGRQQIDVERLFQHLAEHQEHRRPDHDVARRERHAPAADEENRHRPDHRQ